MPEIPTLLEMLKAGMHFGHKTSKWHPKMAPYIFGARSGVHIINLEITAEKLKEALDFIREQTAAGKVILFLGTKKQAKEIVKKYAQDCGMPFVVSRWLGGTITNFKTIKKLINKFKDLKGKQASGELAKYTKKEQLKFQEEIKSLEEMIGGVESLEKLPDVIFVLDVREERTAMREAQKKGISIVAVCDTNVSPEKIDYVIPANDDAVRSIEIITRLVAEAVKEGKKSPSAPAAVEDSADKKASASVKTTADKTEDKEKEEKEVVEEKVGEKKVKEVEKVNEEKAGEKTKEKKIEKKEK